MSGPVTSCYPVVLDGRVIGNVEQEMADDLVKRLRVMKAQGLEKVCFFICYNYLIQKFARICKHLGTGLKC